jgi:hypothetical protein
MNIISKKPFRTKYVYSQIDGIAIWTQYITQILTLHIESKSLKLRVQENLGIVLSSFMFDAHEFAMGLQVTTIFE